MPRRRGSLQSSAGHARSLNVSSKDANLLRPGRRSSRSVPDSSHDIDAIATASSLKAEHGVVKRRKLSKGSTLTTSDSQENSSPNSELSSQQIPSLFSDPSDESPDGGTLALRQRWNVERRYTRGDSWDLLVAAMAAAKVLLHDADVPHTGCCKAYALVLLLRPVYAQLGALLTARATEMATKAAHGAETKGIAPDAMPKKPEVYKHVKALRAQLPAAIDDEELKLLRSSANANRSGYIAATNLEDAKLRVAVPFDKGRALGYSMSPVWLEEFETSVTCAHADVACLEFHSACASNGWRSHMQIVLPSGPPPKPGQPLKLSDDTELVVLRRIGCHYHAVWINNRARTPVRDLPCAVRSFLGI